jgi:hypothetical protein
MNMKLQSLFLVFLLFTNLLRAQEPTLHIAVIAGEGARQQISEKVRVEPAVQVQDQTGKSIEGAAVVFTLPSSGPGGTFENGSHSLTVSTDVQGRAIAHGIHLNRLKGPFDIHVAATFENLSATAEISQISVTSVKRSSGPFGVSTKTWVLVGLGAILIAGAIIGAKQLRGGPNPNILTAAPGVPVVGGPK